MFGAPPQNPNNIFLALCSSNTPILGIQKHLCWPMVRRDMGVWGATPEPKHYFLERSQAGKFDPFLALPISNTPILAIQKHLFWPMMCRYMGVWGTTPYPHDFCGIVHFKHTHPRYPKTPFLAHDVQRYGCLGRHPRTQTIFF